MVITIGILLFVGFSFILTAIFIKKSVIKKTTNCTKCIDAKIVDIKKEYDRINPDSMRHLRYRNYYQYTYNNDIFNVESKILTSHQKYKKGQTIKLYINPNNPEEFYNKEDNYNILIYIFSIVGIVLFAISLILIVTQSSLRENHNENIYDNNISDNDVDSNYNDDNRNKTAIEFSNSIIDIQKYVTLNKQDNNYSNYTIDLNTAYKDNKLQGLSILEEYNINFKYKVNDYEIQLKLKDNDDLGAYVYGVYINDKHIYDDYAFSWNNIGIDVLGKYLLFRYNGCTDIRCQRLILTDNTGNVTSLYELDDVSGLVATFPTISNDGITLKATRITHNGAIVYDDEIYEVYHNDECKNTSSILPDNLLIQATYTYKYNDGVLNLTPEVTNKITLDEYLKDENNCN